MATNNIGEHYTFSWKDGQWVFTDFKPSSTLSNPKFLKRNLPRNPSQDFWGKGEGQAGGKTAPPPNPVQDTVPVPKGQKNVAQVLFFGVFQVVICITKD